MMLVAQGGEEWHQLRLGKATASRIADVVARTKTGVSASRETYMAELIAERLTGVQAESYTSAAMQWGTEKEADAKSAYEYLINDVIEPADFIPHPTISMSGASPDGFVGQYGLIEAKCPQTSTHIDTLLRGQVPGKYLTQMLWQMACTGRAWCDFVSFDPRMPEHMQLFVRRIPRDDVKIKQLEKDVVEFLAELDTKLNNLKQLYAAPVAA